MTKNCAQFNTHSYFLHECFQPRPEPVLRVNEKGYCTVNPDQPGNEHFCKPRPENSWINVCGDDKRLLPYVQYMQENGIVRCFCGVSVLFDYIAGCFGFTFVSVYRHEAFCCSS